MLVRYVHTAISALAVLGGIALMCAVAVIFGGRP